MISIHSTKYVVMKTQPAYDIFLLITGYINVVFIHDIFCDLRNESRHETILAVASSSCKSIQKYSTLTYPYLRPCLHMYYKFVHKFASTLRINDHSSCALDISITTDGVINNFPFHLLSLHEHDFYFIVPNTSQFNAISNKLWQTAPPQLAVQYEGAQTCI